MSEVKLRQKIEDLENENRKLKNEILLLNKQLQEVKEEKIVNERVDTSYQTIKKSEDVLKSTFNKYASAKDKVNLFSSLFSGRHDVYAERFIHSKTGKPGYAPKKLSYWGKTDEIEYVPLNADVYEQHLRGEKVIGVFPITSEDECFFLAIDLDGKDWKKDSMAIQEVCINYSIPFSVERSRSGNGAHLWFFFSEKVKASVARKLGSNILKAAMSLRHELTFDSFDRLFPNQNFVPKGGFGNLIALPLQKNARLKGNSVFVDQNFVPFEDQWAYLFSVDKVDGEVIGEYIQKLEKEFNDLTDQQKAKSKTSLSQSDFPEKITIILSNRIQIKKDELSSKAISAFKWMSAFYNPEFYQLQAMRRSTYRVKQVISCYEEDKEYLFLPRGLYEKVSALLTKYKVKQVLEDIRENGEALNLRFKGQLRPQQVEAVNKLLEHDNGVLSGSTAFGKTVAALHIIAKRNVNTIILVNKVSLVEQWKKRIKEFLAWDDSIDMVGQLGGGKKKLTNKIDVVLLQSLYRKNEVHECIQNYGMVIVDECHHISAFSFEKVLEQAPAKYVYGLTATPKRKDGHEAIIHMQAGPIRYQDDRKKQSKERPFDHTMSPKFLPLNTNLNKEMTIQEIFSELIEDKNRNERIVEDVVANNKKNRCSLVLTERIEHINTLYNNLSEKLDHVYVISGSLSKKQNRETIETISSLSKKEFFTIISTGKYIGEGFDEPRLDTLFLTMPISWKGRLEQYAGRLHRLYGEKSEVNIIDYADIHVSALEKMYQKRLKGYKSMGYTIKISDQDEGKSIYEFVEFEEKIVEDMFNAKERIVISSPSITNKGIQYGSSLLDKVTTEVEIYTKNPLEIINKKNRENRVELINKLEISGYKIHMNKEVFQHFVVIDDDVIWYGSINIMGHNTNDTSFIRLNSPSLVKEFRQILKN